MQLLGIRYRGIFWLNLTDAELIGLYRLHPLHGGGRRGEMVIMDVLEEFRQYVYGRGWLPKSWLVLKHIKAVVGECYCAGNGRFIVNGKFIGPVYGSDQEGRPLPKVAGCRDVPVGHFIPVATHISGSFDGS